MNAYNGRSLAGWAEEYVNALCVEQMYSEYLRRKTYLNPGEYDRIKLQLDCQRLLCETAKGCLLVLLKEKRFSLAELSEAFVLLEPYISGRARSGC